MQVGYTYRTGLRPKPGLFVKLSLFSTNDCQQFLTIVVTKSLFYVQKTSSNEQFVSLWPYNTTLNTQLGQLTQKGGNRRSSILLLLVAEINLCYNPAQVFIFDSGQRQRFTIERGGSFKENTTFVLLGSRPTVLFDGSIVQVEYKGFQQGSNVRQNMKSTLEIIQVKHSLADTLCPFLGILSLVRAFLPWLF